MQMTSSNVLEITSVLPSLHRAAGLQDMYCRATFKAERLLLLKVRIAPPF